LSGRPTIGAALLLLATAACTPDGEEAASSGAAIAVDATDPDLERPGTIFRSGPATPEEIARPLYPPIVRGAEGVVSIYEGYFVRAPCSRPLRVDANSEGDTILVRVVSETDTARTDTCAQPERPTGYSVLVGEFPPADYRVRIVHEGDRSRPTRLDTVYDDITVKPKRR
jgi:hypothetical protein